MPRVSLPVSSSTADRLMENQLPVFVVVPSSGDVLHDKVLSNLQEVRARGAKTIVWPRTATSWRPGTPMSSMAMPELAVLRPGCDRAAADVRL